MNSNGKFRSLIMRYRKWLLLILVAILLWTSIVLFLTEDYRQKRASYLNAELESFESKVYTTLRMYETFSEYVFRTAVNRDEVMTLLERAVRGDDRDRDNVRQELYRLLQDDYALMTEYDFRQLHFHRPNGDSFLRFHAPEQYGDNLFSVRETVRLANEEKRYVFGFEEGRIFNGYRFVYPLIRGEEHLGTVEVSVSLGSLMTVMGGLYPEVDLTFVIDEGVVRSTVFDDNQDNYAPAPFFPGFLLDLAIEEDRHLSGGCRLSVLDSGLIRNTVAEHRGRIDDWESFNTIVEEEQQQYLMNFLAIENISGQPVAYLVGINEIDGANIFTEGGLFRDLVLVTLLVLMLVVSTLIYDVKQKQLKRMATTDKLTGLYNRHRMVDLLEREVERHQRYGSPASVIMLDLDHFKDVNDRFGHSTGDRVLKETGLVLRETVRRQDAVARWGGEEFLILLPETGLQEAGAVANRLRQAMEEHPFFDETPVTASFGVATIADGGEGGWEAMVHKSDENLYRSKQNGRNQVTL